MILGYFVYMEGTVCNQIIEGNTNKKDNQTNLPIRSIIVNLSNVLFSISPITFIMSVLVFIYSLCLIYGLYSLN
jgi:hypothetical protein